MKSTNKNSNRNKSKKNSNDNKSHTKVISEQERIIMEREKQEITEGRKVLVLDTFVYHETFKLGQIKKVVGDTITIYFFKKKELHDMSIGMAFRSLKILPKGHIMILKAGNREKLREKVLSDPIWAFRILIKSYGGSITLAEVRKELQGSIIPNYFNWIMTAIEKVNADPHFIQIFKDGKIAFAYSDEIIENKNKISNNLKIIPARYKIYIRPQHFLCLSKKHKIESLYTYIPVKTEKGIKTIKVFIERCLNCKKFFISDIEFDSKLQRYSQSLLRCFVTPSGSCYGPNPIFNDSNSLSCESILKQAGYTVSKQYGLDPLKRQQILDEIIIYGIFDVATVKSYLQFYIGYLGKNENMYEAVDNWIMDLNYVNNRYSKLLDLFE